MKERFFAQCAKFLVKMNNRFCVALSTVEMPPLLKECSQFSLVVDFAIESDPNRTVFIRHWLMAAPEVHDGKTPMPKTHRFADPRASIVGTSMHHGITHRDHLRLVHALVQPDWISNTANCTHKVTSTK